MVTYMEPQAAPSYMSVTSARRTLCIPIFICAPHAQPSLSNIPKWDSSFSEPSHSCGTTNSDKSFHLPPKIKIPNLHIVRYMCQFKQCLSHRGNGCRDHPSWAPTKEPTVSCWRYTPSPYQDRSKTSWKLFVKTFSTQFIQIK